MTDYQWTTGLDEDELGFWQFDDPEKYLGCQKDWPSDTLSFWDVKDEEFTFWSQFLNAEQLYSLRFSPQLAVTPLQLKEASKALRGLIIPDLNKVADIRTPGNMFKLYSIDGVSVPDEEVLEKDLCILLESHYQTYAAKSLMGAYKASAKVGSFKNAIKSYLQMAFVTIYRRIIDIQLKFKRKAMDNDTEPD